MNLTEHYYTRSSIGRQNVWWRWELLRSSTKLISTQIFWGKKLNLNSANRRDKGIFCHLLMFLFEKKKLNRSHWKVLNHPALQDLREIFGKNTTDNLRTETNLTTRK